MKQKRSMDEAITAAKKLRSELTGERPASDEEVSASRLKVVVPEDIRSESKAISQPADSCGSYRLCSQRLGAAHHRAAGNDESQTPRRGGGPETKRPLWHVGIR